MIKPEINVLIFNEFIKRGYKLQWNTRVFNIADSKLWYITPEQAQAFLDLEKSEDYQKAVIQKEIDLINNNIDEIKKDIQDKPLNIIDLGCWDWKKSVLFIKKFHNINFIRYCPIDISSYMVEQTIKKFEKIWIKEVVKFQWNISDFENLENIASSLRSTEYKDNLLLLLWNTLWNFEANELLYKIKSCMKENDTLIIWNWINNQNWEEILNSYNNDFVNNFLVKILTQIWMKEEDLQFGVWFRNSRLELYYVIKRNFSISFLDKKIDFKEWDQIIIAIFNKYTKEVFESYIKTYFSRVKTFFSEDWSYALTVCKL